MSLSEAVSRARSRFNLYVADTDMPSFLAELARCQVTEADFDIAVNRCSRLRETMAPSLRKVAFQCECLCLDGSVRSS